MRTVVLACLLGPLSLSCTSKKEPKSSPTAAKTGEADHEAEGRQAAKALLREYVDTYRAIAIAGDATTARGVLEELRDKAVSTQHLPEEFERRYFAMLDAGIALLSPATGKGADPKRHAKVEAFVKSAGGPDAKFDPNGGIAAVSKIFIDEIVELRLLVDPDVSRDDVHSQYFPQR